jgi:hypothetical protein
VAVGSFGVSPPSPVPLPPQLAITRRAARSPEPVARTTARLLAAAGRMVLFVVTVEGLIGE